MYDKNHYMKEGIKKVYRHDNATLRVVPLLLYMYKHHLYNTVSRQNGVLHKLQALLVSIGHRKAITRNVQVGMGVEGLENPEC
jgi:hypothetical protein